mmetsp:Transcript_5764/g.13805  ORF Transcript_5764/g.13805 Transcript_5764/m.13805 type:complete len:270 (-) Transcript_5764:273-1082(-)
MSNEDKSSSGIRLVCAGLGRTGTLSLTEALTILGYKPYHYIDFSHSKEWSDFAKGKTDSSEVIDAIVNGGYDAVLENPTCDIYTDILGRYPDAKVVLTVRDNPKAFEASWKILMDTMVVTERGFSWSFPSFFQWIPLFERLKHVRKFMGTTHLGLPPGALAHGWRNEPDGWLAEQYNKHNEHVVANVPKDRLLVFNVKDGWEPLCKFLECEVPSEHKTFPHSKVNTKESLIQLKQTFERAVYGWIPVVVALVATASVSLAGGKRNWLSR